MIFRCAAVLVPFFLIGCAAQSDSQPAPRADNAAASAENTSGMGDSVAEPAGTTQTMSGQPQTAETGTVEAQPVSTETVVMKVPGMH